MSNSYHSNSIDSLKLKRWSQFLYYYIKIIYIKGYRRYEANILLYIIPSKLIIKYYYISETIDYLFKYLGRKYI